MPQFDFYSFSTQVFWVLLMFTVFHFLVLNNLVLSYAQVLKIRQKLYNTYLIANTVVKTSSKTVYDSVVLIFFKRFK